MNLQIPVPANGSCSFCEDLAGVRDCAFVARNDFAAAQVNERQYERGAMLITPVQHRESIYDITDRELAEVHELARQVSRAALAAFGGSGVNIFQNNGISAGQSEAHFHVHVVPRYVTSEPKKRFERDDFAVIPMSEQRVIAAAVREAMGRF